MGAVGRVMRVLALLTTNNLPLPISSVWRFVRRLDCCCSSVSSSSSKAPSVCAALELYQALTHVCSAAPSSLLLLHLVLPPRGDLHSIYLATFFPCVQHGTQRRRLVEEEQDRRFGEAFR